MRILCIFIGVSLIYVESCLDVIAKCKSKLVDSIKEHKLIQWGEEIIIRDWKYARGIMCYVPQVTKY